MIYLGKNHVSVEAVRERESYSLNREKKYVLLQITLKIIE